MASWEPRRQQELVAALCDASERVVRHQPGFVSTNIHASLDGTRVLNYAQWRTREDFHAMLADPETRRCLEAVSSIAVSADPVLYQVTDTYPD